MKIQIKRFDKSLSMPQHKTSGAIGLDVSARETTIIESHEVGYIPLNIAVKIPNDCWILLAARGSTHKLGIMPVHGIGVGDADFSGNNDEYKFPAFNFTDKKVVIEKGTRIGQMIIMRHEKVEIEEVDGLDEVDRGGFGTTGIK